tara:strand:+ start:1888 stop:2307 length:420 start_codon:yes stop_codon:yes gene_type:complete
MKKIILITAFVICGVFTTNAQEETFQITVRVSGLNSNEGKLLIALYNKENQFLKNGFQNASTKIIAKNAKYIFTGIPRGEYAISILHDRNNNNKMDTNFFGIPNESYGCSNNAKGFFGPPKYENAKFQLVKDKTIQIKI